MTSITLIVTGASIRSEVNGILTSGMVGIPVSIRYDEAWNGLTKNLVCRCGRWDPASGDVRTILNVGASAVVAHEVMQPETVLFLGIEGFSADGSLVIPTIWANCGYIHPGTSTGADTSETNTLPIWDQLSAMIGNLDELDTDAKENLVAAINEAAKTCNTEPDTGGNSDGLSDAAKALLITILRNAVYSADQSANITALQAALASGSSSGGEEEPDDPGGGNETATYTVSNILTNVVSSNAANSVAENASYTAALTAADGYEISAVTVLVGGVDVTNTVYANGVISIPAVTGNVIITATAVEVAAPGEFVYDPSKWVVGYAIDATTGELVSSEISAVYDEWIRKPSSIVLTATVATHLRVKGYNANKEIEKTYNSVTATIDTNLQATVNTDSEYIRVTVAASAIKTSGVESVVSNLEVNF